uniref:Bifunctional inhibitor/plant lipid transfer protein/seed storage helical domain-containing protein n=1 Tax=Glycine max TaxID=3847 RepID=A0A0R0FZE7_SOYBN
MDSNACLPHLLVLAITLVLVSHAMGDSAKDKQRCAESLTGVATCLPYLGADAKAPTADCCSGLTQAMKTNNKCVCLILKDRDDPDLGLKINMTIAVGLPSLCKTPDNLSQCSDHTLIMYQHFVVYKKTLLFESRRFLFEPLLANGTSFGLPCDKKLLK